MKTLAPFLGFILLSTHSFAALLPSEVFKLEDRKFGNYIRSGMVEGGSATIQSYSLMGIREAKQKGFHRAVLDFDTGEDLPYFVIVLDEKKGEMMLQFKSEPKIPFKDEKWRSVFLRIPYVKEIQNQKNLTPGTYEITLNLVGGTGVEAFRLKNPARLVVDFSATKVTKEPVSAPTHSAPDSSAKEPITNGNLKSNEDLFEKPVDDPSVIKDSLKKFPALDETPGVDIPIEN